MGKARSFRLTKENEIRFEQLAQLLQLDNANLVFNRVVEDYHTYLKHKDMIDLLERWCNKNFVTHPPKTRQYAKNPKIPKIDK